MECLEILNGFTKVDRCKLFMISDNARTRNNGTTLKCKLIKSDCTKLFVTNIVVRELNKPPPSVVQSSMIDTF